MLPWETDPSRYETLFAQKTAQAAETLGALSPPGASYFRSPAHSYRVRAEFRIWHDGDALDYVMFNPAQPRVPVAIDDFAPALEPIRNLMPRLREALQADPILRKKLFQIEFMASTTGGQLVTLIYHRSLDDEWEQRARALASNFSLSIVGRSRKQKRVIGEDYITDSFLVDERCYTYRQYEQSFVQPNAPVNQAMLKWAVEQSANCSGDLLELYCGNGNFTLPLAANFRRVLATELSKSGTRAALHNIQTNGIDNVSVIRLSAEEVSQALAGVREFRRLAALPAPLASYELNTVFVDPPRAGLDLATLECVQGFDRIIYVSCNPKTLLANLQALHNTHEIAALAFFDQFPYTAHLESGVLLKRR